MKAFKAALISLTFVGFMSALGTVSFAEGTPAAEKPKPAVLDAAAASITSSVEAIDYKTRSISLKGPEGNVVTMIVDDSVVRFNEIKKGDLVQVDYLESVALMVQSPSESVNSAEGSGSVTIRNKTKKPSGVKIDTEVVTATVKKIDAKKRTATLVGPKGNSFDIDIAPDVQHLENVKKGDQVLVKVTRTVAIAVHKPTK